jgi:uracil-DNA glycosylase family 4
MDLDELDSRIVACRRCPRLVAWREQTAAEKRRSFVNDTYWGKPVPNFGDSDASGLIVGLAPAAHGANRTGRMFTGDRSGDWLYRSLARAGLCNQETSVSIEDGLRLRGVLITAAVHCAPPDNKPLPDEMANCSGYLKELINCRQWRGVLCLGGIAWASVLRVYGVKPVPKFGHGVEFVLPGTAVLGSYHPSQQNTFTGRLTEAMLDEVAQRFAQRIFPAG